MSLVTAPIRCSSDVPYPKVVAFAAVTPLLCLSIVDAWLVARTVGGRRKLSCRSYSAELASGTAAVGFLLYSRVTKVALSALRYTNQP